jgi:hypothetical protein
MRILTAGVVLRLAIRTSCPSTMLPVTSNRSECLNKPPESRNSPRECRLDTGADAGAKLSLFKLRASRLNAGESV